MVRFIVLSAFLIVTAATSVRFVVAGAQGNPILEAAKENVPDPKKPFTMVVIVTVKDGKGGDLEAAMKPAIVATRKEKGCIAYDLNRDLKDANKYYVYERWQSLAALEAHMQTEHIQTFLGKVGDIIVGQPELKFFAVTGE